MKTKLYKVRSYMNSPNLFKQTGISAPSILMPADNVDLRLWSVIACDQHTSSLTYWEDIADQIRNVPSSGHLVLPEVYLETKNEPELHEMISKIRTNMTSYLNDDLLRQLPPGFVFLDRSTSEHSSRKGCLLCIDLECYDYRAEKRNLIRATEETVISRIPPRLKIRENAILELPHIMLLIDDPDDTVIGPAYKTLSKMSTVLYDTDLMSGGGHVKGYFTEDSSPVAQKMIQSLFSLLNKSTDHFLFAVGDGNHSLATAKTHWEQIKKNLSPKKMENHPARYALTEVVNLHDPGLDFEPIHRIAFQLSFSDFKLDSEAFFSASGVKITKKEDMLQENVSSCQYIEILTPDGEYIMKLENPPHYMTVGSLQLLLDHISAIRNTQIDYIHGKNEVRRLVNLKDAGSGNIGFILPPVPKDSFFKLIETGGVLPRKTFSMGEAFEKRYYMESRKIVL